MSSPVAFLSEGMSTSTPVCHYIYVVYEIASNDLLFFPIFSVFVLRQPYFNLIIIAVNINNRAEPNNSVFSVTEVKQRASQVENEWMSNSQCG